MAELVDFSVRLEPCPDVKYRIVCYTAEFLNEDGERIRLTKNTRIETRLLQEPYTAAWLLSHIIREFMSEIDAR